MPPPFHWTCSEIPLGGGEGTEANRLQAAGGEAPARAWVTLPDLGPFQVPHKPALWALLLALLGAAPVWARLRACSVPDVLRHYRAVIFEDLQAAVRRGGTGFRHLHFTQKNQTGAAAPRRRGRVGASCGVQKVWGPAPIRTLQPASPRRPIALFPQARISSSLPGA